MSQKLECSGGCHCGAVRFRVRLPAQVEARSCNCSICAMTGFVHVLVSRTDFDLVTDEGALQEYRFNTGTARHLFCRVCGVKSFYQPRSHPQGWSVNFNCIELAPGIEVRKGSFDGRNWEANIDSIRHLGK
jgi:hypothetical protein